MSKQRMKKVFDQESLPMTFYAHTMKFVERNCYDQRCAVVFEAVPKDGVSMFVTGKFPFRISQAKDDGGLLTKLWTDFQRGGLEDPAFMAHKAGYLGKVANAEIVMMSRSFAKTKSIANAKNDWWEITVYQTALSEGEDACLLAIPGYEEIKEELAFVIRPVSAEEKKPERMIRKIRTKNCIPSGTSKISLLCNYGRFLPYSYNIVWKILYIIRKQLSSFWTGEHMIL